MIYIKECYYSLLVTKATVSLCHADVSIIKRGGKDSSADDFDLVPGKDRLLIVFRSSCNTNILENISLLMES